MVQKIQPQGVIWVPSSRLMRLAKNTFQKIIRNFSKLWGKIIPHSFELRKTRGKDQFPIVLNQAKLEEKSLNYFFPKSFTSFIKSLFNILMMN